jgi:ferrous iron transport protein B
MLIDLPGTYSLYPKSREERVVADALLNTEAGTPEVIVYVADASNLQRNLLLFSQIADLGFPMILAINMMDVAKDNGIRVDVLKLRQELGIPVLTINARNGQGTQELEKALPKAKPVARPFFDLATFVEGYDYKRLLKWHLGFEQNDQKLNGQSAASLQAKETIARYNSLHKIIQLTVEKDIQQADPLSRKIDSWVTHRIWGYALFALLMLLVFQAIFSWASLPMDLIDAGISGLANTLKETLPHHWTTYLLTDGIIAGFGGILVFIPQIALLFFFVSLLEESGYMARVMFIMDKLMRRFGLNGKSVVPMISGVACAVPAIMSARGIENQRDRLITIMVTPLISCSARIPVFTVLVALAVPATKVLGFFNLQGIVFMGLYLLGVVGAIGAAWVFKKVLPQEGKSYFVMEFPSYKWPKPANVLITMYMRVKSFVVEAGRVILAISVVLWFLSAYGPGNAMEVAEAKAIQEVALKNLDETAGANLIASRRMEVSFAGEIGRFMEPAIRPLGFDWKIGIALLTSFAAREVFVGTMATLYAVGDAETSTDTLLQRLKNEINPATGLPTFTLPVAMSLVIFYVFAMQCMSTLAVVYRETGGWKWPLVQLAYMSVLAYLGSWVVFNLFS